MKGTCLIFICATMFFLVGLTQTSTEAAQEQEEIVRAKIGIQITSDQVTRRAKKRDRIKPDDALRIYISPDPDFDRASIYVMYDNQESVEQLYQEKDHRFPVNVFVIPGRERYTIDGKHPLEQFTIICSPQPLPEIETFLEAQTQSLEKWLKLEQELIKKSQLDMSDESPRLWRIAGTVRGDQFLIEALEFLEKSPIFSGKTLVVRKYELRVEK